MANYRENLEILSFDPNRLKGKTKDEMNQTIEDHFKELIEKKEKKQEWLKDKEKQEIAEEIKRIERAYINLCMDYDILMGGKSFHERALAIYMNESYHLSKFERYALIINIGNAKKERNPRNKEEVRKEMLLFDRKMREPAKNQEIDLMDTVKIVDLKNEHILKPEAKQEEGQVEEKREEAICFIDYIDQGIMTLSDFINLARIGRLSYELDNGEMKTIDCYGAYLPGTSIRENPDVMLYANLDRAALKKEKIENRQIAETPEEKEEQRIKEEQRKQATELVVDAIRREVNKGEDKEIPTYFGNMETVRLRDGKLSYEFVKDEEEKAIVQKYEEQKRQLEIEKDAER